MAERPGRQWWARREEAVASEPRGDGLPKSLAQQQGQNLSSACSQGSCLGLGPGNPRTALGPDPGARDGLAAIPRLPARARSNKNESTGVRQCCHTQEDAAAARPDPAERPPDSPAPPAPPGSPLPPPFRRRRPHPRHAVHTAQQRLIGQRHVPPLSARAGPRASGTTGHRPAHPPSLWVREDGSNLPASSRAHISKDQTALRVRILRNK